MNFIKVTRFFYLATESNALVLLLKYKPNLNAQDNDGNTALFHGKNYLFMVWFKCFNWKIFFKLWSVKIIATHFI